MDTKLIERYVDAVKTFLPGAPKDDIGRELYEDLYTRLEAQEAKLGRPLTDAEQENVLKQLGHPAVVAGRYRTDNRSVAFGRQLIGPELFPLYIRVLAISLGLMLVGRLIALYFLGETVVEGLFGYVVAHFAIVTAIFTAAQIQLSRYPERWNPRDPLSPLPTIKDPMRVSRTEVIMELVFISVFLMWLRSLWPAADLSFGEFTLTPIWRQIYLPMVALAAASLVPPAIVLFRPRWLTFRLAARAVLELAWLALWVVVLRAGEWVHLASPASEAAPALATLNHYIELGLLITVGISAVIWLWEVYILFRHLRERTALLSLGVAAV